MLVSRAAIGFNISFYRCICWITMGKVVFQNWVSHFHVSSQNILKSILILLNNNIKCSVSYSSAIKFLPVLCKALESHFNSCLDRS